MCILSDLLNPQKRNYKISNVHFEMCANMSKCILCFASLAFDGWQVDFVFVHNNKKRNMYSCIGSIIIINIYKYNPDMNATENIDNDKNISLMRTFF